MNKKDRNAVEKSVIDAIINQTPGSAEWCRAYAILDKFQDREQKQQNINFNERKEELRFQEEIRRYDLDREDRINRENEERKESRYRYDTDRKDRLNREAIEQDFNERKFEYQKQRDAAADAVALKTSKRGLFKDVLCALIGAGAAIGGTVVAYNMYDKQTTKAFQFEENGTITANTGKGIMDGLKPPKK